MLKAGVEVHDLSGLAILRRSLALVLQERATRQRMQPHPSDSVSAPVTPPLAPDAHSEHEPVLEHEHSRHLRRRHMAHELESNH
jgi:hypothetical protein